MCGSVTKFPGRPGERVGLVPDIYGSVITTPSRPPSRRLSRVDDASTRAWKAFYRRPGVLKDAGSMFQGSKKTCVSLGLRANLPRRHPLDGRPLAVVVPRRVLHRSAADQRLILPKRLLGARAMLSIRSLLLVQRHGMGPWVAGHPSSRSRTVGLQIRDAAMIFLRGAG